MSTLRLATDRSLSSALDWQPALVALATAVVERGGTIVVPANAEVAITLALTTYPRAYPHGAERSRRQAPVAAVETGGMSEASRRLLGPLVHRNALTYHERDGELVPAEAFPSPGEHDGVFLFEQEHHPLAGEPLEDVLGAVIIHPDEDMTGELFELQRSDLRRLAVFGGTGLSPDLEHWAADRDPSYRLLEGLVDRRSPAEAMPYGLVMELLVDEWLELR